MRRFYLLVCLFVVACSSLFADEYVISKIDCCSEDFYERQLALKYDDKSDVFYLFRSDYSSMYWFTLSPSDLVKLRTSLVKYKEWEELAKTNITEVTKELPDSSLSVKGTEIRGNDIYETLRDLTLHLYFISITKDAEDSVFTMLYLKGGEMQSRQNKYHDIEFESVTFLDDQVDALIQAISQEAVDAAVAAHNKKKADADLFN